MTNRNKLIGVGVWTALILALGFWLMWEHHPVWSTEGTVDGKTEQHTDEFSPPPSGQGVVIKWRMIPSGDGAGGVLENGLEEVIVRAEDGKVWRFAVYPIGVPLTGQTIQWKTNGRSGHIKVGGHSQPMVTSQRMMELE